MFNIYDYRTGISKQLNSNQLKAEIITTTNSVYENRSVSPERTGKRPTLIEPFLNTLTNGILLKGVFLVTALGRVNSNVNTRYMLIATGDKDQYKSLLSKLNSQIPFIHIDCSSFNPTHEGGYLSSWFRNNMGRAFSFIDIDFIFIKTQKIILIEEKTSIGKMSYGQEISYKELLKDIFNISSVLCFVKYNPDTNLIEGYLGIIQNNALKTKNIHLLMGNFITSLNK